mmetsp:Transcript_36453/g.96177  ORF Transcript_36453/g.96177 Transcript_36453/m.96177 type:complete len:90 (-) Transcript_36453:397-666(-)
MQERQAIEDLAAPLLHHLAFHTFCFVDVPATWSARALDEDTATHKAVYHSLRSAAHSHCFRVPEVIISVMKTICFVLGKSKYAKNVRIC